MKEYSKNCQHCGNHYTAKNSRSKYCKDSCRVKAYHKRKGITFATVLGSIDNENVPEKRTKRNKKIDGFGVAESALGTMLANGVANGTANLLGNKDLKPMTRGELVDVLNFIINKLWTIENKLEQKGTLT